MEIISCAYRAAFLIFMVTLHFTVAVSIFVAQFQEVSQYSIWLWIDTQ